MRFDELELDGISLIPNPPRIKRKMPAFDRSTLLLAEVWLTERPAQFTFSFYCPLVGDPQMGCFGEPHAGRVQNHQESSMFAIGCALDQPVNFGAAE
ncbi:MAG: hypothetical protein WBD31_26095, partial [Rubripirellula sp.]